MGEIFKLEHANIVAYLTSRSDVSPRVRTRDLLDFLNVLKYQSRDVLIHEVGRETWPDRVSEIAARATARLEPRLGEEQDTVSGRLLMDVLEDLRSELSQYVIFALAVGSGEDLKDAAYRLAKTPLFGCLLVLIPEQATTTRNLEVLDPIPAFSVALHAIGQWPGFAVWTITGAATFVPHFRLSDFVNQLRHSIHKSLEHFPPFPNRVVPEVDALIRNWSSAMARKDEGTGPVTRRLLHLSDLHFGTEHATRNQAMLDAELADVVKKVDRVVITGDLFDTPDKKYAQLFSTFKGNITRLAGGRDPIAITGNHDQRVKGLFGKNYEQAALFGPSKVVVDDNTQMVFICFNSSEDGQWARGRISTDQFARLGGEYRTLRASRPALNNYLPIVLVHHHPFSFDAMPTTWLQRVLARMRIREEALLEMENAEDLHNWCLDWRIKTILHGHKHKARYVVREVSRGSHRMDLTAIGCGSSLGAEGTPMSYNLLEWVPQSQRWIASFFESVNGGQFHEVIASVSPEAVNSP